MVCAIIGDAGLHKRERCTIETMGGQPSNGTIPFFSRFSLGALGMRYNTAAIRVYVWLIKIARLLVATSARREFIAAVRAAARGTPFRSHHLWDVQHRARRHRFRNYYSLKKAKSRSEVRCWRLDCCMRRLFGQPG